MVYLAAIIVLIVAVAVVVAVQHGRRGGAHRRTDVAAPGLVQAWRERRAGASPSAPRRDERHA